MNHDKRFFPLTLGIGTLFLFSACTGTPASAQEQETPSSKLPAPSRSGAPSLQAAPAPGAEDFPWSKSPPFSSHDFDKPLPKEAKDGLKVAVLAGGCFWCLEAVYELMPGVIDVVSGYIGGEGDRPSYQYVSMGRSNHAEAVRIVYDPAIVSYDQLLDMFWKIHNPTTLNRQGYDIGTQYRSAIFYMGEEQKKAAAASIQRQQPKWASKIVTEVVPAGDFWIAEEYHQDFFRKNPDYGYCVAVVAPKVEKSGLAR